MHVGPLPEETKTYEVYILWRARLGKNLYTKVGISWPNYASAVNFRIAYEQTNPWAKGKAVIMEKVETYTQVSDYEIPKQRTRNNQSDETVDTKHHTRGGAHG